MATIPFATLQDADTRSRDWWLAILERAKRAEDVTEFLFARAVSEQGDIAIVVHSRDGYLDTLLRQDQMTPDEIGALVDLYPLWEADTAYSVDDIMAHSGQLYRVVQAHTSQSDWQPPNVPALFTPVVPAGVVPEWVQPLGSFDAYQLGDRVTYLGNVYESTINANVWPPGVFGWVLV